MSGESSYAVAAEAGEGGDLALLVGGGRVEGGTARTPVQAGRACDLGVVSVERPEDADHCA